MENKSNSLSRIKRQQREKVLRFSIRKYSFGAASVAVAALMFLGARVASADSLVDKTSQLNAGVVNPKNEAELPKESPDTTEEKVDAENQALTSTVNNAPTVDKAKLKKVVEELNVLLSTKLNLDESVVSPVKDRLQKGKEALESSELAQKDIDELVELLSKDVTVVSAAKEATEVQVDKQADKTEKPADNLASQTSPEVSASEESQTVSAKKDTLKVSVDQLQAAVLELPEHETSKEVLEKANELLGLAQGVLENTTVSLNDVEDMTKRVKRMFNSVKNATTRLTSGARDSRNGKSMGEGAQFRATTVEYGRVENALINVKEYISEAKGQGTTTIGNRDRTISKTFMTAKYSEENGKKFITYDVYFQNDGKALYGVTNNTFWFYPPRDILYGSGEYPVGTIYEAYYERYRNDAGTGTLSQNPNNFTKVGNTYNIPLKKYVYQDSGARQSWNDRNLLYQLDGGPARNSQRQEMLKNLEGNSELNSIIKSNGSYPGASYSHILTISSHQNYAYKYHVKMRLRDNVTTTEAQKAGTMAVTTKAGSATNATAAYVYAGLGTRLVSQPDAPLDPIQGLTVRKTVGDPLGDPDDPVNSGYVKHKNGKSFPAGMTWSWVGGVKPTSTAQAGVFKYTSIATYKDGTKSTDANSHSDGRVTVIVKPKQPTITTNVANKKGLTNQQITVNVGSGVKDGSTVKIYDGNTVIGTGTTKGETATVTVKGALPGNPITAETVVNNGGTVTSVRSNPVTPTDAPDKQPPTLEISPSNQTVVEGDKVTFTVTARDNKVVNIDGSDFLKKYGTRITSGKATNTNVKTTDSEKVTKITITTSKEDIGKTNTITFNATDNAGNKAKPVNFTFTVTPRDTQKPEATLNGVRLTENADTPIFTVYRGATFNPELKVWDNSGVISKVTTGNLPYGITASTFTAQTGKTEKTPYTTRLSSGTVLNTQTLGDHIGTLHVEGSSPSDSRDLKFKYRVVDIESKNLENGVAKVPVGSTLNVANSGKNIDAHNYLKVVDSKDLADRGNNYLPSGMTWTWKQGDKLEPGTTLDNAGKYTRNATAIFPSSVSDVNSTTRKTFAPVEIKRPVVLAVTPTAPSVVGNENGSVTITPPTRPNSTNPQDIDTITLTYTPTGKTSPETVTVTKSGNTWTATVNGKPTDKVSVTPAGVVTIPDSEVADKTEVTAKVSKRIDNNLTLESPVAKDTTKNSKPQTPVATAKDNGDVTGKPQDPAKVDKITVSYIGEDNQPKTAVGKKDPKGNWTVDKPEVQINPNTGEITIPADKVKDLTEVTVVTKNGDGADSDSAKAVARDTQKPQATLNGVTLTETANSPIFTVYRGAEFNPELKVWDNSGTISKVTVGNLPYGVTASNFTAQTGKDGSSEDKKYKTRLSSGTVVNTQTLGEHIGTLHVEGSSATDSRDLKFKYRVVDIETRNLENGIAKVPVASTLNVANSGKNIDAHRYLKVVDSEDKADRGNNYLPSGMTWTWKAGDKLDSGTTLDNSGKYTRNATAVFPDTSKNSITDVNSTTRTTFAPAEIKRQVVLAVTPTVPSIVGNSDGSVTITPPTRPNSTNPQDIDTITLTYVPTGKTTPETVTVTKSGNTWTATVNGKPTDKVSVTPAGVVTIPDSEVADKTEVTAKVSKRIDNVVLESPVARGTANGSLGAEVTPPAPVLEKEKTTPVTVVTPNKPGSTITTETPVNGLTVDGDGNLTGTPTVTDWGPKEEERKVTIPVKVKHGDEVVPVNVPVTIQRDTDGDGIPDKVDTDDDNDGIPDKDEEKNGTDPKTPTTQTPTIDITRKPNGDAVVTPKKPDGSTYPPGTKVEIPGEDGTPITVTIGDNGSGEVPNDKLPKGDLPGKGTVTEPNKNPSKPVEVTTPARKTPTVELEQDPDTGEVTVTPKKPDGTTYPPGTKVEIPGKDGNPITVTIGEDGKGKVPNSELPEGKVPGTSKITVPGKPSVDVPNVTTPSKLIPTVELEQDPDTGEVTVTPKKPDGTTYPPGTKVEIPGKDGNPITVTIGEDGKGKVPNSELPEGKVPGTSKITVPGKPSVDVPNVTTPSKLIPTVELEQDPDTGEVTVTPKKPDGTTYPPGTKVEIPGKDGNPITVTIGEDGKGKVPNSELPEGKVPGTSKITVPGKPSVDVPNVTTPSKLIPTVELEQDPDTGEVTVTPKKPDGTTYPPGTKVEIPGKDGNPITVTIGEDGKGKVPNSELPEGKVPGTSKITVPGKPSVDVPNVTTPSKLIPTVELEQDPDTGEVTVTPKKPDGTTYPPGTKVEIPGKDGNPITVTIGEDGKGKVPNSELPEGKVPGTSKITVPGKPSVDVPNVTTPSKLIPTVELEQDPDTGEVTVTPKKPDGTTYPPGTKVEIPGKDGNPITVTIGEDGKGKVPNSELPEGKVPGTSKITVPGKPSVDVPNVTTPSKLIPTVELEQDPDTGEVTVTPKKPDGTTYPPGTKVEIPGKDGNPITVTIGEDGKGKVPNSELPEGKVPGTSKITVPGKPSVDVPNVTTPSKLIPTVELEQDPDTGEVTVTPKKPDGTTYPPGTKVEIPGKDGNPITVTIGEDGKGKVPNSELPEGKVPGTSKITVPGKPSVDVPNVTTPSKLIPTVELEQDPDTGEVTVTPKKPDGTTYPPGTKVEIPGKDGNPITVTIGEDGKGKVPNSELPEGKVPGTSKITVPGKPSVDVPNVTTPSKIIPGAPTTEQPVEIEITRKPNGDAVVTPKKPGGSTYPPGTKVEIPGEDKDGNPITITVTIDDNGSGEVPNDNLPKKDVPGTGTVTEPKKNPSQPVKVTTPARKTPTLDVEQDPKTGDVTVTPKKPDGSKFSSGTKVEIPGKDKDHPITVTIGEDGKGKVPNSELPEGKTPGTGKITEPGKPTEEVPEVTTPAKVTPTVDLEQDPKTGDVTVTPKQPDGSIYPPGTVVEIPGKGDKPITVTIGEDGKGKVPNSELPDGKVTKPGKITEPGKPSVEVPEVTTPAKVTPTVDLEQDPKTGDVTVTPKKPDGSIYPPGTVVEIPGKGDKPITVTIGEDGKGKVPNSELPDGKVTKPGKITEPGKPAVEVPEVTTPAKVTPTVDLEQDPKTGDVTVTPKKPDGSIYPPGTVVEIPGKGDKPITVTIGEDGKGKVPNSELPDGKVTKPGKITEPGKPAVEVPEVTTPAKVTPTVDLEQDPKTGDVTVTPKQPDGSIYPPGTVVEIPGKGDKPITVTIGEDGKGKVPNSELPDGKVTKPGKITEPGKPSVEVPEVTTPAKVTPTVDLEQDPKTGDVTVTPKKPDGSTYPPGTKVEIPGKDKDHPITVTIGEDGKGKVPNSDLPEGKAPGTGKITEPGKPAVEVPNVTTPGKVTPETPVTEKPGKIEITQQPNGNAIVTPKKPDGSTYPPGSKVEIPGENGTTITVTIGDNGSGEVPNDKLPKKDVPGTGTVTEPNKKPSQPVDVTTPARKTPTVELEQDPKTGDVTVTPKKPDGSTYPPGTTVEIPGKDGNPITVTIGEDGKGKVPNSELPDGKVPGTAKITEPGQPAVEVPVETPAKVTPATPTDTNPVAPVTPDTPVKPDTNGGSGQDTPAPATPIPNAVTPNADQVDTKTTVDNGAKSNDSQNVLPNTGTESNAALASLGLLGLLSGFGLVARKKKED